MADGKAFGALTIYSGESDPFSNEEVRLLSELANDLAYGITAIRLRIAHAQAEECCGKAKSGIAASWNFRPMRSSSIATIESST